MILVDKLCYLSKLRYVNAGEKFAFAMLTLVFCIVSRSIAMGIFVMAVTGFLTVYKGGIAFTRYLKLMMVPLAFLLLSTAAIIVNIARAPLSAFALPVGGIYLTGSWESILQGVQQNYPTLVQGVSLVVALTFIIINIVVDMLYILINPRIRTV